jgi:hypothetical protein
VETRVSTTAAWGRAGEPNEMKLRIAIVLAALALAPQARAATYLGGPVLANPHVVPVDFGNMALATQTEMTELYRAIATSASTPHFLFEYQTPTQTFGAGSLDVWYREWQGTSPFTFYDGGYAGSRTDVGDELAAYISVGMLPVPDANTVYMVHMPTWFTVVAPIGASCDAWCGMHYYAHGFAYAIIPDFTSAGSACAANNACTLPPTTPLAALALVASHELLEAETDPQPAATGTPAWTNEEIGDQCKPQLAVLTSTIVDPVSGASVPVQRMWSNAYSGCVSPEPTSVCCGAAVGQNSACGGVGATETCPIGSSTITSSTPIVTGSRQALTMRAISCTQLVHGINAITLSECVRFTGLVSPRSGTMSTVCFDPPPNGTVQSCQAPVLGSCLVGWAKVSPTLCCLSDATSNQLGHLCGSVPDVLVR